MKETYRHLPTSELLALYRYERKTNELFDEVCNRIEVMQKGYEEILDSIKIDIRDMFNDCREEESDLFQVFEEKSDVKMGSLKGSVNNLKEAHKLRIMMLNEDLSKFTIKINSIIEEQKKNIFNIGGNE